MKRTISAGPGKKLKGIGKEFNLCGEFEEMTKKVFVGFETGSCHFCGYQTKTKPYPVHQRKFVDGLETEEIEKIGDNWLCDFCCQLSFRDMEQKIMKKINWGLNHILTNLKTPQTPISGEW